MKNIKIYERKILEFLKAKEEDYKSENCLEFISNFDNCELKICMNSSNHLIQSVTVNECSNDPLKLGMMKAFCSLLKGLPILEAKDHGVLRLENLLREETALPVQGIIMPLNSCSLFEIPLKLIYDLYSQYTRATNYDPLVNTYRPKEIQQWKNLQPSEREKILFELIDSFCKEKNIIDYKANLIGDVRLEFVTEKISTLPELLLELEKSISTTLGFSLEVMFTEKQDTNAKRRK